MGFLRCKKQPAVTSLLVKTSSKFVSPAPCPEISKGSDEDGFRPHDRQPPLFSLTLSRHLAGASHGLHNSRSHASYHLHSPSLGPEVSDVPRSTQRVKVPHVCLAPMSQPPPSSPPPAPAPPDSLNYSLTLSSQPDYKLLQGKKILFFFCNTSQVLIKYLRNATLSNKSGKINQPLKYFYNV